MNSIYDFIKYRLIFYPIIYIVRLFFKKTDELKIPHFFILGSGRNGSTLLASILNGHRDIVIPPEQFLLPYIILRKYLFYFFNSQAWLNNVKKLFRNKSKTTNWNIDLNNITLSQGSIAQVFNQIFLHYKNTINKDAKYWGDKSPLNTNFIKYIYPEFKNAKYIFLIRDPRDVMLSYKKMLAGKKSNYQAYALMKWEDSIRTLDYLQKRTDVLQIRYEDLVNKKDKELRKIQVFLNIDILANLSDLKEGIESMGVTEMSHHQNLRKPISNISVGRWKNELPKDDLLYFNTRVKLKMERFNYT